MLEKNAPEIELGASWGAYGKWAFLGLENRLVRVEDLQTEKASGQLHQPKQKELELWTFWFGRKALEASVGLEGGR